MTLGQFLHVLDIYTWVEVTATRYLPDYSDFFVETLYCGPALRVQGPHILSRKVDHARLNGKRLVIHVS